MIFGLSLAEYARVKEERQHQPQEGSVASRYLIAQHPRLKSTGVRNLRIVITRSQPDAVAFSLTDCVNVRTINRP